MPTLVEVTAPSDMPEGYEFKVELEDGTTQTVLVPAGGAKAGETFKGELKSEKESMEVDKPDSSVKTGEWGAPFCICTELVSKRVWWLNCCCTALGLAQVQERLGFSCTGKPAPGDSGAWSTLSLIFWICVIVGIFFPFVLWVLSFIVFVLTTITRYNMRKKYNLPVHETFGACDGCLADCCASYWCNCCTIIQMSAHITPDLEAQDTKCCSATGF